MELSCFSFVFIYFIGTFTVCYSISNELPNCNAKTKEAGLYESEVKGIQRELLVVSTLDGKISALDPTENGQLIWSQDTEPGALLSSSISNLELFNNGQVVQLIPSLDGNLYTFNGETLEPISVTADTLLQHSFKFGDGNVLTGGKETSSYGINPNTGEIHYMCGMSGCITTGGRPSSTGDVLLVKRHTQILRCVDSKTGVEKWNFSVGELQTSFIKGMEEGCGAAHQLDDTDDYVEDIKEYIWDNLQIKAFVSEGIIAAIKDDSGRPLWSHKLESPVVNLWKISNGAIEHIDLFNPNVFSNDFNVQKNFVSPLLYLGRYNNQPYIQHTSEMLKLIANSAVYASGNPIVMLRNIHWRPYLVTASSRTPHIHLGNHEMLLVGKKVEKTATTALILRSDQSEYPYDSGYYLYENKNVETIPSDNISKCSESDKEEELTFQEMISGSIWDYWKQITAISIILAITFNMIIHTLRRMHSNCSTEASNSCLLTLFSPRWLGWSLSLQSYQQQKINLRDFTESMKINNEIEPLNHTGSRNKGMKIPSIWNVYKHCTYRILGGPKSLRADYHNCPELNDDDIVKINIHKESETLKPVALLNITCDHTTEKLVSEEKSAEYTSRFLTDFDVVQCLGRGGFGVVYEARNKLDDCSYAIKRICLPNREDAREKVRREVKALAKLDHVSIVRYFHTWLEYPPIGWQEKEDKAWESSETQSLLHVSASPHIRLKKQLSPLKPQDNMNESYGFLINELDNNNTCTKDNCTLDANSDSSFEVVFQGSTKERETKSNLNRTNFLESDSSNEKTTNEYIPFKQYEKLEKSNILVPFQDSGCGDQLNTIEKSSVSSNNNSEKSMDQKKDAKYIIRPSKLEIDDLSSCLKAPKVYLYIQMQLCQKETLKDWLNNTSDRDRVQVLDIFHQIVSAVEYVHEHGLMHRDLKPSNIFFSKDGLVKVGDFGLVTAMTENELHTPAAGLPKNENNPTCHTHNVGTQLYMSPEQIAGETYNYKVDIFSLGVILFELLFPLKTHMERVQTLTGVKEQRFPKRFKEDNPKECALVQQLVSVNPEERPLASAILSHPLFEALQPHPHILMRTGRHRTFSNRLSTGSEHEIPVNSDIDVCA